MSARRRAWESRASSLCAILYYTAFRWMDDMPILSLSEGYWDKQVWQGFSPIQVKSVSGGYWLVLRFRGSAVLWPRNRGTAEPAVAPRTRAELPEPCTNGCAEDRGWHTPAGQPSQGRARRRRS